MTLLEEARDLIKANLAAKPHLSTASMARACGMSPTTARSIIQGEVKKTALENIVSLLSTFMSYEEISVLVNKHDKGRTQAGALKVWSDRKATAVESNDFEWEDPDHEIAALASSTFGTTRERISKLFGDERGIERLESLLNAGILREVNGKIRQQDEYVSYSIDDSQKKAALQTDRWKRKDIDKGGFLYHFTQNYTKEGHEKACERTRVYLSDLDELGQTYGNGDMVLMLSIIANLLNGEK